MIGLQNHESPPEPSPYLLRLSHQKEALIKKVDSLKQEQQDFMDFIDDFRDADKSAIDDIIRQYDKKIDQASEMLDDLEDV